MRLRNRTGVIQVLSSYGITLRPGVWTDVGTKIPRKRILDLHKDGKVEIDWDAFNRELVDPQWINNQGKISMLWMSPFSPADGYATASESTVLALVKEDFDLYLLSCWFSALKGLDERTIALLHRGVPEDVFLKVGLCMATPGEFRKLPTSYRIGLTMYEASDPLTVHPEWEGDCQYVDEMIVPSQYCKDVFSQFVDRPISVLPLGINQGYAIAHKRVRRTEEEDFTFFSHGTLTNRKAPLETLEAFQKAFPKNKYPHVKIVFKTRLGIFGLGQNQIPNVNDSRVTIINQDWTLKELLDQFLKSDAYVFPTRGEGYGMTPREAMMAGLPTMFTDCTGLSEVANPAVNWPIPVKGEVSSILGGTWYEPDWDYVIDSMRWMVNNRIATYDRGLLSARYAESTFGPDAISTAWKDKLSLTDSSQVRRVTKVYQMERVTVQSLSRLETIHKPYFDTVNKYASKAGIIWDLGVGTGLSMIRLQRDLFRVYGILVSQFEGEVAEVIHRAIGTPQLKYFELDAVARSLLPYPRPEAIVSQGVLQCLYPEEVQVILKGLINRFGSIPIILSMPSVNFPGTYCQGSKQRALDNWWFILQDFEIQRSFYYGPDRRHVCIVIKGFNSGIRGTMVKRLGKEAQGVWRPTTVERVV